MGGCDINVMPMKNDKAKADIDNEWMSRKDGGNGKFCKILGRIWRICDD